MKNVRLTDDEQKLLDEVVAGRDAELRQLVAEVLAGRKLTVLEANRLRDAIGEELAETGIDAEIGAVDERGKRLDDLIDRVAALSALHDGQP